MSITRDKFSSQTITHEHLSTYYLQPGHVYWREESKQIHLSNICPLGCQSYNPDNIDIPKRLEVGRQCADAGEDSREQSHDESHW